MLQSNVVFPDIEKNFFIFFILSIDFLFKKLPGESGNVSLVHKKGNVHQCIFDIPSPFTLKKLNNFQVLRNMSLKFTQNFTTGAFWLNTYYIKSLDVEIFKNIIRLR